MASRQTRSKGGKKLDKEKPLDPVLQRMVDDALVMINAKPTVDFELMAYLCKKFNVNPQSIKVTIETQNEEGIVAKTECDGALFVVKATQGLISEPQISIAVEFLDPFPDKIYYAIFKRIPIDQIQQNQSKQDRETSRRKNLVTAI